MERGFRKRVALLPPTKIVSRRGVRAQNSSQLRDRERDGLTRPHLANRDELQRVAGALLVDAEACQDVIREVAVEVDGEASAAQRPDNLGLERRRTHLE